MARALLLDVSVILKEMPKREEQKLVVEPLFFQKSVLLTYQ